MMTQWSKSQEQMVEKWSKPIQKSLLILFTIHSWTNLQTIPSLTAWTPTIILEIKVCTILSIQIMAIRVYTAPWWTQLWVATHLTLTTNLRWWATTGCACLARCRVSQLLLLIFFSSRDEFCLICFSIN